ncbi:hypothetical protein N7495_000112 [Penicillium taxi]|uniref:uncharacterized protein n=1 Tax=Penicillium taxi TaxID=168475 RepID=UPI00254577A4|nr:uncharacterized protein N7495_000112 [Penicillium taxi]KAJ5907430.1 hypothetical protein N7495_000112 [Penicillium taxi]
MYSYCLIAADKKAFAKAKKVRMPAYAILEGSDGFEDFADNSALMDRYITTMGGDPTTDIRIVWDEGATPQWEIILPASSLNQNGGGLGIVTLCRKTKAELPKPDVNVEEWPWDNAVGEWESWEIDGLLPGEECDDD